MATVSLMQLEDGLGIMLPAEILTSLNIKEGDPLEIEIQNGTLIITPKGAKPIRTRFSYSKAFSDAGIDIEEILSGSKGKEEI